MQAPKHIFDGIRVLDFSQVLAGPTTTRFLVEMGAEVIKVEPPPRGDLARSLPYLRAGRSGYHIQQNRGKKSLCVDLKTAEGRELIEQLLPHIDVLVESFTPGVFGRLGFDYEGVSAANPRIVMCSISAFGQEGPLAAAPGYDNIGQAYAGVTSMVGEPGGPPALIGLAIGDVLTGVHGAAAIASALFHRERTGEGQYLDVSLLDSYFHCHEMSIEAWSGSEGDINPTRMGSHHYGVCPFGVYEAPDGFIFITAPADKEWARLCGAIGRPELADDPHFATNSARCERVPEVVAIVEEWLARQDSTEAALAILERERVPVAPILSIEEAMNHPHLRARGTARTVTDRVWGSIDIPGFPLRFGGFPDTLPLEASFLGEHNREVLGELIGVGDAELDSLSESGVLFAEQRPEPSR
jgi:crotonobetainyl-CoA:carnitine CoA-transferase CaiB-like acyl-CoA transferase